MTSIDEAAGEGEHLCTVKSINGCSQNGNQSGNVSENLKIGLP